MMKSLDLTVFLLIACLQGAKAADKELGEGCAASDTCVHPSLELVCDDVTATCLIKQGKDCSGDGHGGLCVTGAACSGTCTCGTAYAANANGKCDIPANLWMATCTHDANNPEGDCTASSGLVCPAGATRCKCEDNKHVDVATGKCTVAITATKVGTKCTTQTECGDKSSTNLECPTGGGVCACVTGYTGSIGGDCTQIPAAKAGRLCPTDPTTNCGATGTTNLECGSSPQVCVCASDYYGVTAGDCYPAAGELKGGCSGTGKGTCTDSDALCTGTGAKLCKKDLGGTCTTAADCAESAAVCDEFSKKCLLPTGQDCNSDAKKDKCVTGASCDTEGSSATNNCKCIASVYTESNNLCYAAEGKATGTCKATDPKCDDANAECDTNPTPNRCTCKSGYKVKNADATCESGAITVMTSAMTVMLAAVSSRLFTLH